MACQEEIVLFVIPLATRHENWHLQVYEEVRHNFYHLLQSLAQGRSKSELDLALCFCVLRRWMLLVAVLRLETASHFGLVKGNVLVLVALKAAQVAKSEWAVPSQGRLVFMLAKREAQPENRNIDNRQEILSCCRSFLVFSFSFSQALLRGLCNLHNLCLNGHGTLVHIRCMTKMCKITRWSEMVQSSVAHSTSPPSSVGQLRCAGLGGEIQPTSLEGVGAARECASGVKMQGFDQQTWKLPLASPPVSVSVRGAVQRRGVDF